MLLFFRHLLIMLFLVTAIPTLSCRADIFGEKDRQPGMPRFKKRTFGTLYATLGVGTNLLDNFTGLANTGIDSTLVAAIDNMYTNGGNLPGKFDISAYAEFSAGYVPASLKFVRLELAVMSRYVGLNYNGTNGNSLVVVNDSGTKNTYDNAALQSQQWRVTANGYLQYDIPGTRLGIFAGGGFGIAVISHKLSGNIVNTEIDPITGEPLTTTSNTSTTLEQTPFSPALTYEAVVGATISVTQGFLIQVKLKYNFLHPPFSVNANATFLEHSFDLSGGMIIKM